MSSLQAKFVTDRQTDNGKRIWPLAFDAWGGGHKTVQTRKLFTKDKILASQVPTAQSVAHRT